MATVSSDTWPGPRTSRRPISSMPSGVTWAIVKVPGRIASENQKNALKLKRYSTIVPSAQIDARMTVNVMNARISLRRTTLATMTNSITYEPSSVSFFTAVSNSSVSASECEASTRLRHAITTTAPTATWIQVARTTGRSRPPAATTSTHTATRTGSTRRSNLRSIGSEIASSISLNGTSHTTTRNAAISHGSTRVVRGQSPALDTARATVSRRSAVTDASRPGSASPTFGRKAPGGTSARPPEATSAGRTMAAAGMVTGGGLRARQRGDPARELQRLARRRLLLGRFDVAARGGGAAQPRDAERGQAQADEGEQERQAGDHDRGAAVEHRAVRRAELLEPDLLGRIGTLLAHHVVEVGLHAGQRGVGQPRSLDDRGRLGVDGELRPERVGADLELVGPLRVGELGCPALAVGLEHRGLDVDHHPRGGGDVARGDAGEAGDLLERAVAGHEVRDQDRPALHVLVLRLGRERVVDEALRQVDGDPRGGRGHAQVALLEAGREQAHVRDARHRAGERDRRAQREHGSAGQPETGQARHPAHVRRRAAGRPQRPASS